MISVLQGSTGSGVSISLSLLYHVLPSPDSSTIPSLSASLWLPTSHSQAKEKKTLLPVFVLIAAQWGWAVCVLGQGLQIMTCRGLVDL